MLFLNHPTKHMKKIFWKFTIKNTEKRNANVLMM